MALAAAFDASEESHAITIASRIGVRTAAFSTSVLRASQMKNDNSMFTLKTRKRRSDCTEEVAMACIVEWCHEYGSHVDTNARRVYKVTNPVSGAEELHPLHVWNEVTWVSRHRAFLSSETYQAFVLPIQVFGLGVDDSGGWHADASRSQQHTRVLTFL